MQDKWETEISHRDLTRTTPSERTRERYGVTNDDQNHHQGK